MNLHPGNTSRKHKTLHAARLIVECSVVVSDQRREISRSEAVVQSRVLTKRWGWKRDSLRAGDC